MGFIVRKRTKGAKSWTNFHASRTGGIGISQSQKIGNNLTLNFGKKGLTTTYNLGNGARYVKTIKLFAKKKEVKTPIIKSSVRTTQSLKTRSKHVVRTEPRPPKTLVQRRTNMFRYQLRELYRKENAIAQSNTKKSIFTKYKIALITLFVICIIVYLM